MVEGSGGKNYDPFGWVRPVAVVGKHEEVIHALAEEDGGDLVVKLRKAITDEICGAALAIDGSTHGIGVHWEVVWTVS